MQLVNSAMESLLIMLGEPEILGFGLLWCLGSFLLWYIVLSN